MYKLTHITEEHMRKYDPTDHIEMTIADGADLSDMYESFKFFIRACGYCVGEEFSDEKLDGAINNDEDEFDDDEDEDEDEDEYSF